MAQEMAAGGPVSTNDLEPSEEERRERRTNNIVSQTPAHLDENQALPIPIMVHACFQCKNRKVKCRWRSDSDVVCVNCDRLRFDCRPAGLGDEYSSSNDPNSAQGKAALTLAGTVRKRVARACVTCHQQKARCTAELPRCKRCVSRGFKCEYLSSKRKVQGAVPLSPPKSESSRSQSNDQAGGASSQTGRSPSVLSPGGEFVIRPHPKNPTLEPQSESKLSCSEESMGCDTTTMKTHLNAYFDYVYALPNYSILHRALFTRDFNEGKSSPCLLRAVCAAGSQYLSRGDDAQERRARWMAEAEYEVMHHIDVPSIVNIQTLLLLVFCNASDKRYKKVLPLLAVASQMAYISRLNYEKEKLPFMKRETQRRLMWGLCMADTFYSGGLPEFTTCSMDNNHIKLPCSESAFAMDVEEETEPLHPGLSQGEPRELGIVAYYIRILDIRSRVLRCNRRAALQGHLPNTYLQELDQLRMELHHFHKSLPRTFEFSERSMVLHAYAPVRKAIIMMKVWWQQCFMDLYRVFVPGLKESFSTALLDSIFRDSVEWCRNICIESAYALSEVFKVIARLESSDGFVVTDQTISATAYQCSKILLQARIMQNETPEQHAADILERLRACAAVLEQLRTIFPSCCRVQDEIHGMIQNYYGSRESSAASSDGTPGWTAVNQEKLMSKHGPFEALYSKDSDSSEEGKEDRKAPEPTPMPAFQSSMMDYTSLPPLAESQSIEMLAGTDPGSFWPQYWGFQFNDGFHFGLVDDTFDPFGQPTSFS